MTGRWLARRLEAGLTQLELARLAGVRSATTIRRLERGLPTTERSREAVEAVLRRRERRNRGAT